MDGHKILIVNIHWQQVYSGEVFNQNTKVDISLSKAGLYFVQIKSDEQNVVRKVVKE